MIHITKCPTCGSRRIKKVRRAVRGVYKGQPYTVPGVQYHECPDCGEHVYQPEAMRKIEAGRAQPARVRLAQ